MSKDRLTESKLWTVISLDGHVKDAFDESEKGCGGGPETCGGCRNCILMQIGPEFKVDYGVTTARLKELGKGS
jgi:hypothetical protein